MEKETVERLVRMETTLVSIKEHLDDQKEQDEKLDKKIDKILENDKDKLQRITKTETTLKNVKASLYVFFVALIGAVVKSFV